MVKYTNLYVKDDYRISMENLKMEEVRFLMSILNRMEFGQMTTITRNNINKLYASEIDETYEWLLKHKGVEGVEKNKFIKIADKLRR